MAVEKFSQLFVCICFLVTSLESQELVNVAIGKNYSQLSIYSIQGSSSNAANNNTSGLFDENNCIHTGADGDNNPVPSDQYHWWEVDLGRTYPIHTIHLWARDNYYYRLFPCNITVDNQHCTTVPLDPNSRHRSVTCSSLLYGQRVRVTLLKVELDVMLNLCECQIFAPREVSQCPAGRWGGQCDGDCSDHCGKGPGKNFCQQDTGLCYDGCVGNFVDRFCNECKPGLYGERCNTSCSENCQGGCNKTTGYCESCRRNFAGNFCTECQDGYYKSSEASCTVCQGECHNNASCNKTTGHCHECPSGKQGATCNQTCQAGRYGEGCKETCGQCQVNTTCHHETGHCLEGCVSSFSGKLCETKKLSKLAIPVAVTLGFVVIAIVIVAVVILIRRGIQRSPRATVM